MVKAHFHVLNDVIAAQTGAGAAVRHVEEDIGRILCVRDSLNRNLEQKLTRKPQGLSPIASFIPLHINLVAAMLFGVIHCVVRVSQQHFHILAVGRV